MKIVRILSICSIFLGLSSVAYSEVAPTTNSVSSNRVSRNSASRTASTSSSRTATRNAANNRAVVSRTAATPTITNTVSDKTTASRSATTRTTSGRKTVSRSAINTTAGSSNSSRTTATRTTGNTRNVSSRTGTNNRISTARVGMVTSSGTSSSRYARLTTATNYNLNELIDSTTGYISDNAYDTCKENYFECMDLVCTARSTDKGRCACSDRITAYTEIEANLEAATLELLEVSNSLTLLIASGGDAELMSAALTQSDAEKLLTCVEGCINNNNNGTCEIGEESFACSTFDGADSEIIDQLTNIANVLDGTETDESNYAWSSSISELGNALNTATGMNISNDDAIDAYANKWGLELLEFADPGYKTNASPYTKSNAGVCSRVIDMCFNGIANSWSEAQKSNAYSSSTSYTDSTEPYAKYRTPIKNARGSIRNLYAFNANAACDSYGETLKKKLQNIKTQVISAKALLQQKRLGFKQTAKSDTTTRLNNWNNCYTEAMEYIKDYYIDYGENVTRSAFAVAMNNSSYCSLSMPLVNGEEMTSISTRLYQRYKCEENCEENQICEWIVAENKCDKENTVTVSGGGTGGGTEPNSVTYQVGNWYNASEIVSEPEAGYAFYYVWNGDGATNNFSTRVQYLNIGTVGSYR